MICKECGKILSDYRTECTYCGAPQPGAVPRPTCKKKNKLIWLLWLPIGVTVLAAAMLVILKLL